MLLLWGKEAKGRERAAEEGAARAVVLQRHCVMFSSSGLEPLSLYLAVIYRLVSFA